MNKVVIVTALELEKMAVLSKLENIQPLHDHPEFTLGELLLSEGKRISVVVAVSGQLNARAAQTTQKAISLFTPMYAFFIGVAGGLKDVSIGDIVVGTEAYYYERGKTKQGNIFESRAQISHSTPELVHRAMSYSQQSTWEDITKAITQANFSLGIKVLDGTIASGEKVDAAIDSDLHKHIKTYCGHALAIEMEGWGFLEACRKNQGVKALLLRGISDIVEGKHLADASGSQEYAANNVAHFLVGFLKSLEVSKEISVAKNQSSKDLLDLLIEYYPEGIKDKGIWLRAGGNYSMVAMNGTSAKQQWAEATRLLEKGGGGSISLESLMKEFEIDFPNSGFHISKPEKDEIKLQVNELLQLAKNADLQRRANILPYFEQRGGMSQEGKVRINLVNTGKDTARLVSIDELPESEISIFQAPNDRRISVNETMHISGQTKDRSMNVGVKKCHFALTFKDIDGGVYKQVFSGMGIGRLESSDPELI